MLLRAAWPNLRNRISSPGQVPMMIPFYFIHDTRIFVRNEFRVFLDCGSSMSSWKFLRVVTRVEKTSATNVLLYVWYVIHSTYDSENILIERVIIHDSWIGRNWRSERQSVSHQTQNCAVYVICGCIDIGSKNDCSSMIQMVVEYRIVGYIASLIHFRLNSLKTKRWTKAEVFQHGRLLIAIEAEKKLKTGILEYDASVLHFDYSASNSTTLPRSWLQGHRFGFSLHNFLHYDELSNK